MKSEEEIILTGKDLEIEDVAKVVHEKVKVGIAPEVKERIEKARKYVLDNLNNDKPIYGMNRGVGENKDQVVFSDYYQEYNKNLIYAHCVAVDPEASEAEVRAAMLARLNTLLNGRTGIQPAIVELYRDFLNYGINPVMPKRGSIGQGDIACLSHIGLAMMGEGEVFYKGERMEASKAFGETGLTPVTLGPKDGLAIVSSNALAAGAGALVLQNIDNLIKLADLVYALSLEGLKGNTSPLEARVNEIRPYKGQEISTSRVREYLEDSYLWAPNVAESLQDPISYRSTCQIHGAVIDALSYAKEQLKIQLNSSDDNPCVMPNEDDIAHCSNFQPLAWVLPLETLLIALSHISKNSCLRTIKLSTPKFTKLARFLTPAEGQTIAYGTIQKPFTALDAEIRNLSNPSSVDYHSVAGNIEDHATNSPYVVEKLNKSVDNLYYILGMEVMHAAQAVDLRGIVDALGTKTRKTYEIFREEVPFLEEDRVLTEDIKKAYQVIKSKRLLKVIGD